MGSLLEWFGKLFGGSPSGEILSAKEEAKYALSTLEPYKRNAFLPITKKAQAVCSADDKMGGMPYLRNEADWPVCPNCEKHMPLFLQLNLSTIPERQQEGILQFFYCTTAVCEEEQEGYLPFSDNAVIRIIDEMGPSATITPNRDDLFPEKRIVDWERTVDRPHYGDWQGAGIDIELSEEAEQYLLDEYSDLAELGDKLYGWPHWLQVPEYPLDRTTGTQMELLFQFDSDSGVPYVFGDHGVGYITQSPDNRHELAYSWEGC